MRELALGQLLERGEGLCGVGQGPDEVVEQAAGHAGGEQGVAPGHHPHALDELGGSHVLEHEATRSGAQGGEDVLVDVVGGEDDDPDRAARLHDPPGGRDAVDRGHADVHEHDVRPGLADEGDGLVAVGGLADDLDVVPGVEDHPEAHPYQRLVIDDHHPDGHGTLSLATSAATTVSAATAVSAGSSGRSAWTRNPPWAVGAASSVPPSTVARSCMPMIP